jgi:glycerol-3-phosphate dehydrogenase
MRPRVASFERIAEKAFDLCVIGGGATGAGCALDAQLRGLRTVLLESKDFGSGASTASTKLVHGGVRYLEQAVKKLDISEYRMVKAALTERVRMLRHAPHLAHATEFLVPVFSWAEAAYYRIGMKMYDAIAGKNNLVSSGFLSRKDALVRMPMLRGDGLYGVVSYSDGQFDDARYDISLVATFVEAGGEALNHAGVVRFEKDASGKLTSAMVRDGVTGAEFVVKARTFVNATGPASDVVRQLALPDAKRRLRPSKGVHILFPLDDSGSQDALLVPKTEDGRVIFAVPWQGRLLVGTTDDEATPETKMVVLREEVEYLLRQVNPYLAKPLRLENVVSGYSGLRPLVAATDEEGTKELIRDHEVEVENTTGLISILGGKWTTYRLMAEDTINAVQRRMGGKVTPTLTKNYPLVGAQGYERQYWRTLVQQYSVTEATAKHLARKYGTRSEYVLKLAQTDHLLGEPIVAGLPYLRAEVVYCIRNEMAQTIEDILARRLGMQLYDWRASLRAAPVVADLLARDLNWSSVTKEQDLAGYTANIRASMETLGLKDKVD